MKYTFKPSDLTKEKSLFDIYKSTREIEINGFDFYFTIVIASLLYINACWLSTPKEIILSIRQWSPLLFGFTTTTLGFLITGFTIFATINKPGLFLALMGINHPDYKLTFLKYVYGVFMRVFIYFIAWSAFYLIIMLFGQENGLSTKLAQALNLSYCIKSLSVKIAYISIGGSAIFLVLTLKTFLFNIYNMLMQALRWEMRQ
ncbi:hypothetical protein [Kosakonia cowanii]|uniref:hypothetical protein n=1 Tax=Kosakonia cowanii TaxID=208223 RepID=UPI00289B1B34|nr:hypothetical protein [Kosakonia cowanii]